MEEKPKMTFRFLDDSGNPIEPKQKEETTEEVVETTEEQQKEETNAQEEESASSEESVDESADEVEEVQGELGDGEQEEDFSSQEESDEVEDEAEHDQEEDVVNYEELPEAVQRYLDFYEETQGGTLEDFMLVQQDLSKLSEDEVIRRYVKQNNPYLSDEDIMDDLSFQFGYDPDVDEDRDIRKKKLEKKKLYGEAMKALKDQQSKFKADLASKKQSVAPEYEEALQFRQRLEREQAEAQKVFEQRRSSFVKETEKVFGKNFEGFEVKVGDKAVKYKPSNVDKIKEQNLDIDNFLGQFQDKNGNIKNVADYHLRMSFAADPQGVAEYFYELGKADMVEEDDKVSKNIKTDARKSQPAPKSKNAPKFKFLDEGKEEKSKIKLRHY